MNLSRKSLFVPILTAATVLSFAFLAPSARCADGAKEQLNLDLPDPSLKGTPEDIKREPGMEEIADKPQTFLVPKGVKNVALGKTVTASIKPFTGELSQITDGKKEAVDDDSVEFKRGLQWVQIDLGKSYPIYAIAMWHDHRYLQVMHCCIMQVSDDPEFKTGVTTLFNNDKEDKAKLGVGTNREYFETRFGKVIDGKGIKARYVRGYTDGSSSGGLNCWQEIEVYSLPQ